MDTIKRILRDKGDAVFKVPPEATVMQAVETMSKRHVGAVLVCTGCECSGIFTERDLMSRVVLAGLDPATTQVVDVMTADIACIQPSTSAAEAMAIMTGRRCRHLPVVENGAIVGMVSIGDLVRLESENQQFEIRMLTDYIHGKYPG